MWTGRPSAAHPFCLRRPRVELVCGVAGFDIGAASLQARIDQRAGRVAEVGIIVRIRHHHRAAMRRDHIPERGHIETHVARFEHMGQRTPLRFAREQRQKRGEILRLKLLRPRELPQDRPELVAQRRDRALHEARDRFARFGQHFAVHRVTRRLQRKHATIGRFRRAFLETRAGLRAVEGAIDLDGGDVAARVFELARVRVFGRKGCASPRLIGPPADARADHARPIRVANFSFAFCISASLARALKRNGRSPQSSERT